MDSVLEDSVSVGPFAYLRPGTVLREGSKAGTFVEIKNSDIGAGAKVPHLSYIGDADVGDGTNLGASTITANYDGRAKHRTTIGKGVRSSVHVSFVAPVTVGDEAVYGRGLGDPRGCSRPGALGIARARQANMRGMPHGATQNRPRRGPIPRRRSREGRIPEPCVAKGPPRRLRPGVCARPGESSRKTFTLTHTMSSAMDTRAQQAAQTSLPIDYNKRLMLFSGRANPQLAVDIADKLEMDLGPVS